MGNIPRPPKVRGADQSLNAKIIRLHKLLDRLDLMFPEETVRKSQPFFLLPDPGPLTLLHKYIKC